MSTDLQLRQDLPAIKLPASLKIKLPASPPLMDSTSEESCAIQLEDQEVEECRTPTTIQHRIPQLNTCPPPPKKQRPSAPSCRRRLSEFDFFESVARDEIESFFRSSYEIINQQSSTKKRRCSRL
ncbi:cyclin-dependent protein kinase inhibitor SMR1 [Lactuca sativa]|uniref:cyclin-dependent protein kinase inhibitor SMR1 n=1 Tax=Lactuca sativa TaxID=4236 RepID=UPI000CC38091|nr:cyclin-dependent protein kinase inhibitor SMR1 [Lactuca sativa]